MQIQEAKPKSTIIIYT